MTKFHVNPETGNAGKCSATFKCPYGDLEADHYATANEAREAFEQRMQAEATAEADSKTKKAAKRLGSPIIHPTLRQGSVSPYARYELEYDYDRGFNHPPDEDICRCGTIGNVRIEGWRNDGEGLADYAKGWLGLDANEPLPEDLRNDLMPFVENFNESAYEPEITNGYYGEELDGIRIPEELEEVLNKHYYAQPDAAGPDNILAYLRGKGYDTTGERPLEAIKGALQAENKGRISAKVERANKWRMGTIGIKNIKLPSDSQRKVGEEDPRPLDSPYGKKNPNGDIAGVVLERKDGTFELIDGYHRLGWLKANNKRQKKYIILSHELYQEPMPWQRHYTTVWNQ